MCESYTLRAIHLYLGPIMALDDTRDLRSGDVDRKRAKDHSHKWARGVRPASGVRYSYIQEAWSGSEKQQEKVRPERLPA